MAYVSKEKKAKIKAELKKILKPYKNVKWSLAVRHHSSIVLNIRAGDIDFIKNYVDTVSNDYTRPASFGTPTVENTKYIQVNTFHCDKHFTGVAKEFLVKAVAALNTDNYNRSDIMTDYFDVGHYVNINIGKWDKPYVYAEKKPTVKIKGKCNKVNIARAKFSPETVVIENVSSWSTFGM